LVNMVDLVTGLFAAYGRDASEEQIRAYVAVLQTGDEQAVARAVRQAVAGGSERLPTASAIMRAARDLQRQDGEEAQRNKNRFNEIVTGYYRQAIAAGWTLPQRDELMDVCETAFDQRAGTWRWNERRLAEEVKALVVAVNGYRARCEAAQAAGLPLPPEHAERWGWAMPKEDVREWDPAKESLWDHIKKIF
jgi:hypothetical protein